MIVHEMNVGKLKAELESIPDDTLVFVCCQGYTNYDHRDQDTFCIIHDGKLFITDTFGAELPDGTII